MSRQSYFKTNRRNGRAQRHGVLLLVVLSVLVLFMLIGTAFLVTSSQYRTSAKILEKANRTTFQPGDLVERALMDVLRDTNNPTSVIRYHSLLRDSYGTDGFVARVYAPTLNEANTYGNGSSGTAPNYAPRFASPLYGIATDLSRGQLIDIYIAEQTPAAAPTLPTVDNVIALEPNANGVPVDLALSKTNGYYNGRLLTILTGPCRGQTTRVLDSVYEPGVSTNLRSIYRLRVLSIARADGGALMRSTRTAMGEINDLVSPTSVPATPFVGHTFMVSGKPFNGTGVGFNALAGIGGPRLSAVETFTEPQNSTLAGIETALLPNAVYFNPGATNIQSANPVAAANPFAGYPTNQNPFANLGTAYTSYEGPGGSDESYDAADYQNMFLALQSVTPGARARVIDPDTGLSEQVEAHYSEGSPKAPTRLDLEDVTIPSFHRPDLVNFWFHRLYNAPWMVALISDPQQRAKAILRPYEPIDQNNNGRLDAQYGLTEPMAALITGIKRRVMLRPLREDHPDFDGSNPLSRYGNTAARFQDDRGTDLGVNVVNTTTGQITFPYWEAAGPWDVDNDNDGIADSVWVDIGLPVQKTEDGRFYKPLVAYLIQDMDGRLNLNAHGSAEHFAGEDLDRSNIAGNLNNQPGNLANFGTSNVLPQGIGFGPAEISLRSVLSPLGLPYNGGMTFGDPMTDDYARLLYGRPATNVAVNGTYRAIEETWGRYGSRPMNVQMQVQNLMEDPITSAVIPVAPGTSFAAPQNRTALNVNRSITTIERLLPYDKFDYPAYDHQLTQRLAAFFPVTDPRRVAAEVYGGYNNTGYGIAPDLKASYSAGLDFRGQLIHEGANDLVRAPSVLHDSPYELNIMSAARRGNVANMLSMATSYGTAASVDDDAPFAPAELEKVLRAFDPDASRLPSRITNVVDAFDAKKLVASLAVNPQNPTSAELAQADLQAAINRRQVTTDSFDVPAPNDNLMGRIQYGADGYPGVAWNGVVGPQIVGDDDNDSNQGAILANIDEPDELNAANSDDFQVVMLTAPPIGAGLVDYLRYRIVLELRRKNIITTATPQAAVDLLVNRILHGDNTVRARNSASPLPATLTPASLAATDNRGSLYTFGGLLSPETLAGLKMDLNRPFGDGRDNNGNGVVDEEQEAGEPWIDSDGNGTWNNEPYLDLDGDSRFYADKTNNDGALTAADWIDVDGDGVSSPLVDSLWQQQLGAPVAFDHARGQDASASGRQVGTNPNQNIIHDDARMARQLYARHLYCLMLALVDENYLAPYDPTDPQMLLYLDPKSGKIDTATNLPTASSSMAYKLAYALLGNVDPNSIATPTPAQAAKIFDAKRQAMRKLTCREIAQWAVNCVDMRDPDVIMTPFEYDENPWDGWNVVVSNPTTPVDATLVNAIYPLDGDLATDENDFTIRPITNTTFLAPARVNRVGAAITSAATKMSAVDQTRGVVWGAERPELLMTEGLAWHDRRVEDLTIVRSGAPAAGGNPAAPEDGGPIGSTPTSDDDLDQRLRPQGACFVELYNPWSTDGQRPRDLYRYVDQNNDGVPDDLNNDGVRDDSDGVKLDMLSASQHPAGPSPVWRIAVLCDHPQLRHDTYLNVGGNVPYEGATTDDVNVNLSGSNNVAPIGFDEIQTERNPIGGPRIAKRFFDTRDQSIFTASPIPFRLPDANFPGFRPDVRPGQGSVVGLRGVRKLNVATNGVSDPSVPGAMGETYERYQFLLFGQQCYVERAFYPSPAIPGKEDPLNPGYRVPKPRLEMVMTSPKNMPDANMVGALIPPVFRDMAAQPAIPASEDLRTKRNRLFNWSEGMRFVTETHPDDNTVTRSRAMFIGNRFMPSGTVTAPIMPGRYGVVGTAGLNQNAGTANPPRYITTVGRQGPKDTKNGTQNDTAARNSRLSSRRVELMPSLNPTQQQVLIDGNAGPEMRRIPGRNITTSGDTQPAVAIPITGMSISTPVDNYVLRRYELDQLSREFDISGGNGEGEFVTNSAGTGARSKAYDAPFDTAPELILNQTTPNFRTVTLERLANPLLPWNPPPGEEDHDPSFPVNPYLAIDAMPVDLTAFNGTSELEGSGSLAKPTSLRDPAEDLHRTSRKMPNKVATGDLPRFSLRSVERTSQNEFWFPTAGATNPTAWETAVKSLTQPPRTMWGQTQPKFNRMIDDLRFDVELDVFDLDGNGSRTEIIPDAVHTGGGSIGARYKAMPAADQPKPHFVDYPIMCTLGYGPESVQVAMRTDRSKTTLKARTLRAEAVARTTNGTYFNSTRANVDANGDGTQGDLVGGPEINTANNDPSRPDLSIDDSTNPYFTWNNRPFANEGELLQVPAASSSRMLAYYSTFNANLAIQPNSYSAGLPAVEQNPAVVTTLIDAEKANKERWDRQHAPFGHLLNATQSSTQPCRATPLVVSGVTEIIATGAPNFARILDYVHVPSKFVQTDLLLSPSTFQGEALASTDPRVNFSAPFNRVAEYREPGKVNLNTVVGRRTDVVNSWSEVYDGLMHRVRDGNLLAGTVLQAMGHLGPAWRDVVTSRRGYVDPTIIAAGNLDSSPMTLNPNFPSVVSNPFRNADAGDLVPLVQLVQTPADASILRSHPFSPGADGAWGNRNVDDAWGTRGRSLIVDDADEAGLGTGQGQDQLLFDTTATGNYGRLQPSSVTTQPPTATAGPSTRVPLFSGATLEPALDTERNPAFRYGPMQRLSSMTTTRSGVFAVWITVGFFEVKPAPDWNDPDANKQAAIRNRFTNNRTLYDRVYPEGFTLAKERGSDTGDIHRHRAFYLVDRTLPVAFKPGEDLNVDKAVLVRRRIE